MVAAVGQDRKNLLNHFPALYTLMLFNSVGCLSENKLKITIEGNKKNVDFLDITMDLKTGEYKPYMKPNNTPLYVHKKATTHQTSSKTPQKAAYSTRQFHLTKTP